MTSINDRDGWVRRLVARARWYEFVPEVVLLGGLALFAITEPHAATSGLKSTRAVLLMVAAATAWIVGRVLLWMAVRWPAIRIGLFGVVAAAILKVVVLPAYDNRTVVEALPVTAPVASASGSIATVAPQPPRRIGAGELRGIGHRATGTASLYLGADGRAIIGLEEFDIQPGPAYVLYVVSGSDRHDRDGGTRVEPLRGNKGTQFYDAPTDVDLTRGEWTVLVWCETFDVPVANATPTIA